MGLKNQGLRLRYAFGRSSPSVKDEVEDVYLWVVMSDIPAEVQSGLTDTLEYRNNLVA